VAAAQTNANVNVNIGRRTPGVWGGFYFNGLIDEVRVYNRALNQAEIQTDLNTPLGAPAAALVVTGFDVTTFDSAVTVAWLEKPLAGKRAKSGYLFTRRKQRAASSDSTVAFKVLVTEGVAVNYQWQRDGVDISGARSPSFSMLLKDLQRSAKIRCIVESATGRDTTGEAFVQLTDQRAKTIATHTPDGDAADSSRSTKSTSPNDGLAQAVDNTTPGHYALDQNYPNPFNPTTNISFEIPDAAHVTVSVYDILGRLISTVQEGTLSQGKHAIQWDGTDDAGHQVAGGIYLFELSAPDFRQVRKMLLLR
jgi:hypothetical protein